MRRKSRLFITIIVGLMSIACLLAVAGGFFLYKGRTRDVENSNWSREGEWIVFHCIPQGLGTRASLYLVRPDGSQTIRLTTSKNSALWPSWSPDGTEIVFEYGSDLAKVTRGAKTVTVLPIADQNVRIAGSPIWSPDGKWIAFSARSFQYNRSETLYLISPDGKDLEPVINDVDLELLTWSSDSQWIIYESRFGELRKIRTDGIDDQVYENDVDESIPLANLPSGAWSPIWSPDKQWIVFTYNGINPISQLYRIRPNGTELQQITDLNCQAFGPDWVKMPKD